MKFSKDEFLKEQGWEDLCKTCRGKKTLRELMRAYPWVDKYDGQQVEAANNTYIICGTNQIVDKAWCV